MPQSKSIEKPPIAEHTIAVFSNSYARLPEHFFVRLCPTPVAEPHLIKFNKLLAEDLGLDHENSKPRRWPQYSLATSFLGARIRSPWPMPRINSAISFLSSVMAAHFSLAKSWTATANAVISN